MRGYGTTGASYATAGGVLVVLLVVRLFVHHNVLMETRVLDLD